MKEEGEGRGGKDFVWKEGRNRFEKEIILHQVDIT